MLDAKQLEAFVTVIELGHLASAAQSLHLTVAAISLRLKALEETFGQRLWIRGKTIKATPAGQALLAHIKQLRTLENDLLQQIQLGKSASLQQPWQTLSIACNTDSLANWLLPSVQPLLQQHQILLDIKIDDQNHTHDALKSGDVTGCISTHDSAMRGCVAEPLGIMMYQVVAHSSIAKKVLDEKGRLKIHSLLQTPAVIFNHKDAMTDLFLLQQFSIDNANYPKHIVPSIDAFEMAIELGMGWAMQPQVLKNSPTKKTLSNLKNVIHLAPQSPVAVKLYWHHWQREALSAQQLTSAIKQAAQVCLWQTHHLQPVRNQVIA